MTPELDLENRTVQALHHRGLLRTPSPWWKAPLAAAAAVVFFVAGAVYGKRPTSPPPLHPERYLLLLQESRSTLASPPEVTARKVREYGAWARQLHQQRRLASAEKLVDSAVVLDPAARRQLAGERLDGHAGGFFIVHAASLAEAESIARSSPHYRYGGTIEVRPIEDL